jgi:hypothetical protein
MVASWNPDENNVTLFSSGFHEATIIESVRNPHWCVAHPYQRRSTFTLLYWSVFIGVHTVFDTVESIACFTLSNNHLNHDINHTDRKKIKIIQTKTKHTFKKVFHNVVFLLNFFIFFCEERLEDVNDLLDITHISTN